MCEVPKRESFSRSCFESCPLGSSFERKMFGIAVIMGKCFEGGSKSKKARTTRLCTHQATLLACKAKLVPRTFARQRPTKAERGSHRAPRTICTLFVGATV